MTICGRAATDRDAPLPLERMLRAAALGGLRSQRQWAAPGVRLGIADTARLATAPGERAAAFDGELHNRAELAEALGPAAAACRDDAALALVAHAAWGEDYADRLIGDYACALWDGTARTLLLTVDPGGLRPLHYCRRDGELRVASEARGLWAEPDVERTLDEDRIARWLCLAPGLDGQTFFKGIHRVQPGTTVAWRDGVLRIDRWWRPERVPELRLARDEDYVEALDAAFARAVDDRIDPDAAIGSHLSGGLDSSAVAAFAARRLAERGRRLTAYTAAPEHRFPERPGSFGDEWGHAAAVAARYPNIDHVRVSTDDMPLVEVLALREGAQDTPLLNPVNMAWINAIDRDARDRGITVMLTGTMGNIGFSYTGEALLAQQLRAGRIDKAARLLAARHRHGGASWRALAGELADAALPTGVMERLRALLGRRGMQLSDYSAIAPQRMPEAGPGPDRLRLRHRGDSRGMRCALIAHSDFRADYNRAARRLYGIDTHDPTADRRLFELCLAMPEEQFQLGGVARSLARRMLAPYLPASVVDERRKGRQAPDWAVPFEAALPELKAEVARLRQSRAAAALIDLDRIAGALDRWPVGDADPPAPEYQLAAARALATGRFVRRVEGGNA